MASICLAAIAGTAIAQNCEKCDAPGHGKGGGNGSDPKQAPDSSQAAQRNARYLSNQREINALEPQWRRLGSLVRQLSQELGALRAIMQRCPPSRSGCPPLPARLPAPGLEPARRATLPGRPVTEDDLRWQRARINWLRDDLAARVRIAGDLEREIVRLRGGS